MGSSVGTSIPFFLADRAPEQVGLENEYSRILVDQGWIGLGGWVAFLVWLFMTPPSPKGDQQWRIGILTMYALCVVTWSLAFMGTGAMTSIPGSVMMMTMMGVLLQTRANNQHEVDPGKLRHRAKVTA
jgi:O-antigen ligase